MKTIRVSLASQSYPIWVDNGLLNSLPQLFAPMNQGQNWVIFSQDEIYQKFGIDLEIILKKNGFNVSFILIPNGEEAKSLIEMGKLFSKLLQLNCDRSSTFLALGGGVKEGSWVILTGDPKSGKTTTALQFAATCQSKEYGERPIVYINAEGRLKSMNLGGIKGLEKEKIKIVESEDEPISAEDYLDIVEKYVRAEPNCVVIIDSVSSLIPSRELMDEVSGQFRAGLPKILSNFTKRLGNVVPRQKSIIIMITHFIANTTGYGKTKIADSGVKIRYQVDTHLEIKNTRPWEAGG